MQAPIILEVLDHEEYVDLERNSAGQWEPVAGTRTAFLNLRWPDGTRVRGQIPHDRLDDILVLMFP